VGADAPEGVDEMSEKLSEEMHRLRYLPIPEEVSQAWEVRVAALEAKLEALEQLLLQWHDAYHTSPAILADASDRTEEYIIQTPAGLAYFRELAASQEEQRE